MNHCSIDCQTSKSHELHIILSFSFCLLLRLCGFVKRRQLTVDKVAGSIVRGMRDGQDLITPGKLNKLYVHLLASVLPVPLLGSMVQVSGQRVHCFSLLFGSLF
jgi:hypothetical protein